VDYFNISHAHSLKPAKTSDTDLVILAAAWVGPTRLIDNIRVQL
jgi:pantoate--beta-alanine ligase